MIKYNKKDAYHVIINSILDEREFENFVTKFLSRKKPNKTDVLFVYPDEIYLDRIVEFLSHRYRAVFHKKNMKSKRKLLASQTIH